MQDDRFSVINGNFPTKLPVASRCFMVAFCGQDDLEGASLLEESFFDLFGTMEQEVEVVLDLEVIRAAFLLPLLEFRRNDCLCHFIGFVDTTVQSIGTVFVHTAEDIHIKAPQQFLGTCNLTHTLPCLCIKGGLIAIYLMLQGPVAIGLLLVIVLRQKFRNLEFQELHDAVGQVVAAKIRIAIFVGRFDIDLVGNPLIIHPELTGG